MQVRAALGLWMLGWTACTPEISTGTYFCGPERLCPPQLECDDTSYTCVHPLEVDPFSCPSGSQDFEPDDDRDAARSLGAWGCLESTLITSATGCIDDEGDVDYYTFDAAVDCVAGYHIVVSLSYPVALMPLAVDLLDDAGERVATGALCTPPLDFTGEDRLCLDTPQAPHRYYVRVTPAPDAPDCGGDCGYNHYTVHINLLLP